jgi:signal transduction histidine kinase
MRWSPGRLGLRREVSILVPVAIFLAVFLSIFTLLGYRNGIAQLVDERQSEARRLARGLAEEAQRSRREVEALRSLAPQARQIALIEGDARTVPPEVRSGVRFGFGPDAATLGQVVGWAPVGAGPARRYLRVELPADTLVREQERLRILTPVVLSVDVALAVLVLFFLGHWLAPIELLLERARAAGAGAPREADEVSFLLATFERALSTLAPATAGSGALSALEQALPASFDKSGVLLLDPEGVVLALNRFGADLLGLEPPEPRRMRVEELLAAHPSLARLFLQIRTEGRGVEREECAIETSQGRSTLGLTVHPLRRDDGTLQGYLALFADLTEVRVREERSRLAENLRELGELAAGAAHELRNSLATLRGYLGLAERVEGEPPERIDGESAARRREYWAEIHRETLHLKRVLDDFLTFARPETARFQPVDLGSLLSRIAADPVFAVGPVLWRAPETADLGLAADAQLLERAIKNLLMNAVAASPPGIPVELAVANTEGEIRITVADRGEGIPDAIRPRLFVPFASGRSDGVGLGLALARRIAVLHGGSLTLEDREGGGTCAQMTLPAGTIVTTGNAHSPAAV